MHRVLDHIFGPVVPDSAGSGAIEAGMLQKLARARSTAEAEGLEVIPPMPDQSAELVFVSPAIAQALLDRMTTNRTRSRRQIDRLKADIENGSFHTTNQAIGILDDGLTADGQHRLWAIVETGKAQWMWIIKGITSEAMLAIDRGRSRTLADHLELVQKGHAIDVAAIANVVAKAEFAWIKGAARTTAQKQVFSHYDLVPIVERILEEVDASVMVAAARAMNKKGKVMPSVGGGFYYLAKSRYGQGAGDEVDEFVGQVQGNGVQAGSASERLRTKVDSMHQRRQKLSQMDLLGYLIKAFTKAMEAKEAGRPDTLARLSLPEDGRLPKIPICVRQNQG